MFISYRVLFTVIQDMKSNSNIGNLFLDRVMPMSIVILLVRSARFFDRGRYLYTEFVGFIGETRFELSDYVISTIQSIGYPSSKGRFFINPITYNILYNIYRV